MFDIVPLVLVFVLGTIIGSFLNVVILRFGTGRGLGGRSHCGVCNRTLSFLELVPVVSWVVLRARCYKCHTKISAQYPLVEFLMGILFVGVATQYVGLQMVLGWIIVSIGVCIAVYDAVHMRIPVLWNYALIAVSACFVGSFLSADIAVSALVGVVVVAGLFGSAYLASNGRVLGFGDVVLAVSMGILLGAFDGLFAVWVACVLGSIYGVGQLVVGACKKDTRTSPKSVLHHQVPFGPFLIAGLYIVFLRIATSEMVFDMASLADL
jgi:leader peptidase (prepilin peptidase) / N-methyltransferase